MERKKTNNIAIKSKKLQISLFHKKHIFGKNTPDQSRSARHCQPSSASPDPHPDEGNPA